jgi:zinc ribbon protein
VNCSSCGASNEADALFCEECGASLGRNAAATAHGLTGQPRLSEPRVSGTAPGGSPRRGAAFELLPVTAVCVAGLLTGHSVG